MMRTLLPLLVLLAACESTTRNKAARAGEDSEGAAPLVVQGYLDGLVTYVKHSTDRTDDGRLTFKLVLANESESDLVLVAQTNWFDADGAVVERGAANPIVVPAGQTYVVEGASFSPRATRFNVAVRPATTDRVAE